jgi:transposase InsO family protein
LRPLRLKKKKILFRNLLEISVYLLPQTISMPATKESAYTHITALITRFAEHVDEYKRGIYNEKRGHSSIGDNPPIERYRQAA